MAHQPQHYPPVRPKGSVERAPLPGMNGDLHFSWAWHSWLSQHSLLPGVHALVQFPSANPDWPRDLLLMNRVLSIEQLYCDRTVTVGCDPPCTLPLTVLLALREASFHFGSCLMKGPPRWGRVWLPTNRQWTTETLRPATCEDVDSANNLVREAGSLAPRGGVNAAPANAWIRAHEAEAPHQATPRFLTHGFRETMCYCLWFLRFEVFCYLASSK